MNQRRVQVKIQAKAQLALQGSVQTDSNAVKNHLLAVPVSCAGHKIYSVHDEDS